MHPLADVSLTSRTFTVGSSDLKNKKIKKGGKQIKDSQIDTDGHSSEQVTATR